MAKKIVKKILNKWGLDLKGYKRELIQFEKLYSKYANFTMIPRALFVSNLELCYRYKKLKGDFVECGVWRGGMSGAIAEVLSQNTPIHLFDSFEGLPAARDIDGKEALAWQKNVTSPNYHDNCRAEESYVLESMKLAKHKIHKIYKGWFEQTIPQFGDHSIAIGTQHNRKLILCQSVLYKPRKMFASL